MSLLVDRLLRRPPPLAADAEVVGAAKTTSRIGLTTGTTYAYLWKVHARVLPSAEAPFDATVKEYFAWETAPDVGARFGIRYHHGKRRRAKVDHRVAGTFTAGADQAPEPNRYGYKQPVGGIPAVRYDEHAVGVTIDLRASRQ